MANKDIGDYGIVGDLHTAALIGKDGSIDWCCLPTFDSPSVFAALLDAKKGGFFRIAPVHEEESRQSYIPDTNVLVTRFISQGGVAELTDFMPVEPEVRRSPPHQPRIVRLVTALRGTMEFAWECLPAFNYAQDHHRTDKHDHGLIFRTRRMAIGLVTAVPRMIGDGGASGSFTLREGETTAFLLEYLAPGHDHAPSILGDMRQTLEHTVAFWRRWLRQCRYTGRWRDMVQRSALLLKLLSDQPTGALIAAPTTSLPEIIGGDRNWDYRFSWIRDTAFAVTALLRLGFAEDAGRVMGWLMERCQEAGADGALQVVYRLDGSRGLPESKLAHLDGYRGSRPVRVGNEAALQFQMDIYGIFLNAVAAYDQAILPIGYDFWKCLSRLLDYVSAHWDEPDEGIWEVRDSRHQFVYSKMMCWVALDRGLRLKERHGFPGGSSTWASTRDDIYRCIMERGWNPMVQSFVQEFGSREADASNLLMSSMSFLSPADPRMIATVDRTMTDLLEGGLVSRYRFGRTVVEGMDRREGTFSVCTFWLVEALARAGRVEEARSMFENILSYANPLGLFAEQLSKTGNPIGNYPQALTHSGLISAALELDRKLAESGERG
jgi:GH15 family glucan-1,4-alpha-glucosidase